MVRIKSCCTVKPAEATPNGRFYLSECDQSKAITHALIIYFYRPTGFFSVASAIETLKTSLSQALVHFYPLAGRLYYTGSGGRVELHCNSMGAQFYEATSNATVDDFGDFRPTPILRTLIPSLDYSAPLHQLPLLLVQLTEFTCSGISLGLALSKNLADGVSTFNFISQWARIARCKPLDLAPVLDRMVLRAADADTSPATRFDHAEYSPPPLLIGRSDDKEERMKETTVEMLHLSKAQVEKLKNTANNSRASDVARAYSRFEAVAGHIYKCICKARDHYSGEQLTKLRMPVNCRHRMTPPLPQGYFGNATIWAPVTSRSGELVTKPLSYASSRIREAVETITGEYVRSVIDFVGSQSDLNLMIRANYPFYGNPNLEITTWVGLQKDGADFGWGKEIYMGPCALNFDGKCYILPGHDDGGESFVVAVRLQMAHMNAFKRFFYQIFMGEATSKM